jgi:hypothetical protein
MIGLYKISLAWVLEDIAWTMGVFVAFFAWNPDECLE